MNYTKGEWKVKQPKGKAGEFFDGFTLSVEGDKLLIALCDRKGWDNKQQRLANANLIAAAPDMYEALKEMLVDWQSGDIEINSATRELIDKALAKVEGKE